MGKPILCLDFDGVIHSYTSGWKGADVIPDPPVPGAIKFLREAIGYFQVAIFSSRSHQAGGIEAMQDWLDLWIVKDDPEILLEKEPWQRAIEWPTEKPPAFLTIDDRGIPFTGKWPDPQELLKFKPWNK